MRTDDNPNMLGKLLDANANFDLSARGTTNHCPMALVALARMGAAPDRLQAFFDWWAQHFALPAPPVGERIPRSAWQSCRGKIVAFGALRRCFIEWIADAGTHAVIVAVLQEAPFAPATGAFHALIRLAYGIEATHTGEIASGLAALVVSHLPIDVSINTHRRAANADAEIKRIVDATGGIEFTGGSITSRLRTVSADKLFRHAAIALPDSPALLDEFANVAIRAYWRMPDFTVLHTVTAVHAARIVFAQLPEAQAERLLPDLWVALCAAYVSVGYQPDSEPDIPDANLNWSDARQSAIQSNDDHVIKMTYTCLREYQRNPSPFYIASVARLLR